MSGCRHRLDEVDFYWGLVKFLTGRGLNTTFPACPDPAYQQAGSVGTGAGSQEKGANAFYL
jgi:hypothetical protein